jgi:acetyl-CoA acetyltransferase
MICNENGLKKLGLKPRAVITHLALAGTDPVLMYVLHVCQQVTT